MQSDVDPLHRLQEEGYRSCSGYRMRSISTLVEVDRWCGSRTSFPDVYACSSRYRMDGGTAAVEDETGESLLRETLTCSVAALEARGKVEADDSRELGVGRFLRLESVDVFSVYMT